MTSATSSTVRLDADDAILELASDVRFDDGGACALSNEPWLRFRSTEAFHPGGIVQIRYATSFFDPPARPLLRFWLGMKNYQEEILPAPCEGVGSWIGRAPKERTEVWISPTNRPGRFDFKVTDVRPASIGDVARRAARAPKRIFFAISAGLVGLRDESELNWRWALGAEPNAAYPQWRAARGRTGVTTLDFPRCDWRNCVRVSLVIDVSDATAAEIEETCRSILQQTYPNWRALFVSAPKDMEAAERQAHWERQENFAQFVADETRFGDRELVGRIVAGDRLEEHALACFIGHFSRHPEQRLAYADETRGEGSALRAIFRPGWSPTLQRSINYIGRAAIFRAELLTSTSDWIEKSAENLIDDLALTARQREAGALHRPLFALARESRIRSEAIEAVHTVSKPSVAIVIPSRDKPDLLEACLTSVLEKSEYQNYRVVVVDNDSVDPRTRELLSRFQAADERLMTVRAPGTFNFSALCNLGVETTPGEYLLFLNNDTRVLTPDWIERLLYFASQPEIGAVGAKLLYPNGKTQHVGVLLGMGGIAGHFGAGLDAVDPGWTRRNLVPHEVSAVTGACLMVERSKYAAVGGFDAVNLPVELNDVDLCLRLAARGWRTICNTQVELIHHQSASRGGPMRLQRVYEKERRYFYERWRAVIRDDPYFHPGLSLYSYEEALP